MIEFSDSSPDAGDGEVLRRRFAEDGYLFFRGLLDTEAVEAVRTDVLATIRDAGWLEPDATPRPEGSRGYWDGYVAIQGLESFHRLGHSPSVVAVIERLVDEAVLVHPRKIARISYPEGAGVATPAHQDFRYIQGGADVFTVWAPLSACPVALGGLRVLQGSPERGLLPVHAARGAGGLAVDVPDDDPQWATTDYEAGDVVMFHSLTVHGALPNRTDDLRLSVDYRYQGVSEPVHKGSLHPHFHPKVPGWPELTGGWSSLDPIGYPDGLTMARFAPPDSDLDVPPSRFVTVSA